MSRLFFMTFHGDQRWPKDAHPHESPLVMTVPMMVLAVGSACLGLVLTIGGAFDSWLDPAVGGEAEEGHPVLPVPLIVALILLLVVAGTAFAWLRYARDPVPTTAPQGNLATQAARNDLYQDQVNEGLFMRPGIHLTRALDFLDRRGVDGAAGGLAALIGGTSARVRRVQNGLARSYALTMLARCRPHPRRGVGDPVMNQFPWLTVIGVIPLLGAAVLWLLPPSMSAPGEAAGPGLLPRHPRRHRRGRAGSSSRARQSSSSSSSSTRGSRSSGSATRWASTASPCRSSSCR